MIAVMRDPHEADTGVAPPDRDPGSPAFPIPGWDRYQCLRFLGQGGMGQVFLARDPRLHREVAIKFVRGDARDAIGRLVTESRAQARVNHERVCKVYEVGEVGGEVYIAMEYIDGESFGALARKLTVEQTAMILREAALGVHEAHRAGILHRDLKPSNIMVARAEDGALRPYVMDFGLARDWTAEGTTETGAVLGTPFYMAPEQARGEVDRLDRRADVYSLGASLYHVLTGEPPIPGNNGLEVLSNIADVEPRAPRELDANIPVDLEAIVMKCLEKDRSARYDSARALAEDLDRFLGGEPVAARRAGVWYRLRKRLQKHRRLVAVAGVALGLLAVALAWGIRTRSEAAARERLARRFTELVEHIEAMARYSALSRLHDIRGDQRGIRAKMEELQDEIAQAGAIAVGPGNYALGRGYLALGEEAEAKAHLETAWQHGFHEPRAAYALALVTGHLYQEKLREAERIELKEVREARKHEVEARYRAPVLAYLRQSAGAEVPSTEYVAALVAFYDDQLEDALVHADAIGAGLPWFYEAPELRGDILTARGSRRWNQGDRAGAAADFDAGRKAYAAAGAVGASVPGVYEALGELEYAELLMELYSKGDVAPCFERGASAVARALAVLPDHYASLVLDARLRRSLAEDRQNHGAKLDDLLERAVASARRAVAVAPSRPEARLELGRSYWQWGSYRQDQSQDPTDQLRLALEAFEGVAPADRSHDYHRTVGLVFDVWADHDAQIGADPLPHRGQAIAAFLAAIGLDERPPNVWINLGTEYFLRASHPRDPDPDGDLAQARAALDKARAKNPGHFVPYFYGGQVHARMAERQRAHGKDPRPELDLAIDQYRRGIAVNPGLPHLHNALGAVVLDQARETWDRGGDPDPWLDQARAAFEAAINAAPDQVYGHENLGYALVKRAFYDNARGDDPGPMVRAASAVLRQAVDRMPDHYGPWAALGEALSIQAAFELEQGRDPQKPLAEATAALDEALRRDRGNPQTFRTLGEVRSTRARGRAARGGAETADFEQAAEAFQNSLDLAPDDPDTRLAFGQLYRAWGAWAVETGQDAGSPLRRGLELANQVLADRPDWPEARLLRAGLLLVQGKTDDDRKEQRALGGRALADLHRALEVNPRLSRRCASQVVAAQRLAGATR
jgi:serine/threonine-protein kinase